MPLLEMELHHGDSRSWLLGAEWRRVHCGVEFVLDSCQFCRSAVDGQGGNFRRTDQMRPRNVAIKARMELFESRISAAGGGSTRRITTASRICGCDKLLETFKVCPPAQLCYPVHIQKTGRTFFAVFLKLMEHYDCVPEPPPPRT